VLSQFSRFRNIHRRLRSTLKSFRDNDFIAHKAILLGRKSNEDANVPTVQLCPFVGEHLVHELLFQRRYVGDSAPLRGFMI